MNLVEQIKEVYPELEWHDFMSPERKIWIVDDGDGIQYIAKWEYSKPIPEGFALGKLL